MTARIQDLFEHKYQTLPPTLADLTGFKPGNIMLARNVLSGSDLGVDSRWTVKEIEDGKVVFYPLSARGLHSTRSRPLTGFVPYAAQGIHTAMSYFTPMPTRTNANL